MPRFSNQACTANKKISCDKCSRHRFRTRFHKKAGLNLEIASLIRSPSNLPQLPPHPQSLLLLRPWHLGTVGIRTPGHSYWTRPKTKKKTGVNLIPFGLLVTHEETGGIHVMGILLQVTFFNQKGSGE
mgnify:CR=1 FL=1